MTIELCCTFCDANIVITSEMLARDWRMRCPLCNSRMVRYQRDAMEGKLKGVGD